MPLTPSPSRLVLVLVVDALDAANDMTEDTLGMFALDAGALISVRAVRRRSWRVQCGRSCPAAASFLSSTACRR